MTVIYVTEYNCRCYAVTCLNNGRIKVQKIEDVSNNENIIYQVNPIEIFIGKSLDKEVLNGNTILLEITRENNKYRYVYIGGDMICSFLTDDKIYKYISNIDNNLFPFSIAIGHKNIYYLTPHFKFCKRENIDVEDIDKLFDYNDISNCQKLQTYEIHSNYI